MYRSTARAVVAVHDCFVFAALVLSAVLFFLRVGPDAGITTLWEVIHLLWLAFCVWSVFKALSALIRGNGRRTANFELLMERRAQAGGKSASLVWSMTLIQGLIRLAVPVLLWLAS